eukprot:CAMPEP_0168194124 /NCGR_PEP_ID=MMETSP0139_2-20121125/19007_1 /TAXON_ID=44445 /ORGANISM="Pseudo-nitzschia australis, Strain 10249 10 AB" /LENGTH=273 /DNA_ID=CAMNT_0008117595 /DNA_START=188 /DNA_END=1009 /DNA_ORIENTATION=-
MKEDQDDNARIPRELSANDFRRSSSRSLGKWLGGSSTKKVNKKNNNNKMSDKEKNSSPEKIHYSSSGSTSSPRDARDDRPQVFRATTRKPKSEVKMNRQKEDNEQANSLRGLPPPAAQSAFDGPPRFDWIDIEYNAATMIQAVFRRHMVLRDMEHEGMTTSFIRNRKRERKARTKSAYFGASPVDETAPDLGFGCCAMGFDFCGTDYDAADMAAYRTFQRKQYEEKKKAQKEREEFLSQSYLEQKGIDTSIMKLEQVPSREDFMRNQSLIDYS